LNKTSLCLTGSAGKKSRERKGEKENRPGKKKNPELSSLFSDDRCRFRLGGKKIHMEKKEGEKSGTNIDK